MKTRLLPTLLFCAGAFLCPTPAVLAQAAHVSVTVKLENTTPKVHADPKDEKKPKKDEKHTEKETNRLQINIRNVSRAELKGLQVRTYILGTSPGDPNLSVIADGTKSADLGANSAVDIESDNATTTFTPAHTPKDGHRVKASGQKVSGWAVQVLSSGAVIGEAYSSDAAKLAVMPAKP